MRIVGWNIRAGGGSRIEAIQAQLERWQPDLVGLCEYRATTASQALAAALARIGLVHQLTTASPQQPTRNALLLASRLPLRRLSIHRAPEESQRWLAASVQTTQPLLLGLMHLPNMASGRKLAFMDSITSITTSWRRGPALLFGDTNCGWPAIDEESAVFGPRTAAWLDGLQSRGWRDGFRYLHADARYYTWYSPNAGNGFRLDQAFINRHLLPRLQDVSYEWGQDGQPGSRREALSDHAAMIIELKDGH